MSVVWTCLFKFHWKNHPPYSRWEHSAKTTVFRMNGTQVSHHISSRMKENRVKQRPPNSLGENKRASNRTPDQSSGRPEASTSRGRPRATCGNRITRMASTIHGNFDERALQVRQASLQLTWTYHRQHFLLRILQQNRPQTKQEESTSFSLIFRTTRPELRSMQTHEICESATKKKSWRSSGQTENCRKIWRHDHSRPQRFWWRARI